MVKVRCRIDIARALTESITVAKLYMSPGDNISSLSFVKYSGASHPRSKSSSPVRVRELDVALRFKPSSMGSNWRHMLANPKSERTADL